MQYLERFYAVSENLCIKVYTVILFATRNHSVFQPENNSGAFVQDLIR